MEHISHHLFQRSHQIITWTTEMIYLKYKQLSNICVINMKYECTSRYPVWEILGPGFKVNIHTEIRITISLPVYTYNIYIYQYAIYHIDGLVQDCSNSIANTLKLLQSCTKPSIYWNYIKIIKVTILNSLCFVVVWWGHFTHILPLFFRVTLQALIVPLPYCL